MERDAESLGDVTSGYTLLMNRAEVNHSVSQLSQAKAHGPRFDQILPRSFYVVKLSSIMPCFRAQGRL